MTRQPFILYPCATIRSIDVKKVIESAENKPLAKMERWAARTMAHRKEQDEAERELKAYLTLAHLYETIPDMERLTAEIYWASLDPHVAALRYLSLEERGSKAMELASQGYTIDKACQVDQEMLPEDVMQVRLNCGFTWVPAANQENIPTMPGADIPGLPAYNPNKPYPKGSIVVSVDALDYPPYGGAQPVIIPRKPQVGEGFLTAAGMVFLPGTGLDENLAAEGNVITQNGIDYVAHVNWTKRPPIYFTLKP